MQGSGEDTILTSFPAVLQGEHRLMRHEVTLTAVGAEDLQAHAAEHFGGNPLIMCFWPSRRTGPDDPRLGDVEPFAVRESIRPFPIEGERVRPLSCGAAMAPAR